MITIQDAIERAKLAANEDGILNQEFYNMLVGSVSEEDVHPLTMSLVENGLMVRTGYVKKKESKVINIEEILRRVSRRALKPSEGFDTNEDGEDEEEPTEIPESSNEDYDEIRNIIESAGLSVSKDGIVSFYESNIPGMYTERLPQEVPIPTVIKLWEQKLEMADSEKDKVKGLQDILSRLKSQVKQRYETNKTPKLEEIDNTLTTLESHGFEYRSKSETTKSISDGLENVFDYVMSNDWVNTLSSIDEIQEKLDIHVQSQIEDYEKNLYIWDALDKLWSLKQSDQEGFESVIGNFGGLAARLLKAFV